VIVRILGAVQRHGSDAGQNMASPTRGAPKAYIMRGMRLRLTALASVAIAPPRLWPVKKNGSGW
jgi:hypothetical protein